MTPGGRWLDAQRLFEASSPLTQDQARAVEDFVKAICRECDY